MDVFVCEPNEGGEEQNEKQMTRLKKNIVCTLFYVTGAFGMQRAEKIIKKPLNI